MCQLRFSLAMQIYMVQNNIQRWSFTWWYMQACLCCQTHGDSLLLRRLPPVMTEAWGCTCADYQLHLPDCLHCRCRGLREGHHHRCGELRPIPERAGLGRKIGCQPGAPARGAASLKACSPSTQAAPGFRIGKLEQAHALSVCWQLLASLQSESASNRAQQLAMQYHQFCAPRCTTVNGHGCGLGEVCMRALASQAQAWRGSLQARARGSLEMVCASRCGDCMCSPGMAWYLARACLDCTTLLCSPPVTSVQGSGGFLMYMPIPSPTMGWGARMSGPLVVRSECETLWSCRTFCLSYPSLCKSWGLWQHCTHC